MKNWFFSLLMLGALTLGADEVKPVKLSQAIDFLDNAYFTTRGNYYSKEELAERLRAARDAGIRKIYFRGTGGVAYYPSRVRRVFAGEARRDWSDKLVRTIYMYDVVAEYVKVCHELGMEIYYWEPIFDDSLYTRYFPGTKNYRLYGEWPFRDMGIPVEHYVAHRYASRPREELHGRIGRLELYTHNLPKITADNLVIYTAPHDRGFTRYDKPFRVEVKPQGRGALVVIDDLEIADPVIKLMGKDEKSFRALSEPKRGNCARAFYTSGRPVNLFTSCEFIFYGDDEPEKTLRGTSGSGTYWGSGKVPMIVRFGDFDRYAIGVPEFAYRENRDRLREIVSELYERYPGLDGIAFSIRSHSLPAGGSYDGVKGQIIYGFSQPIVDEYERRYGVNIIDQPYDDRKLLALRGEYLTLMLKEISELVHDKGGKLEMMAPVRLPISFSGHGSMYPWWRHPDIDAFFDISAWAKNGYVDNVIMLGTDHQQRVWSDAWQREVRAFREKLAGTKTKLTIHYLINAARHSDIDSLLPEIMKMPEIDEIEFYEEHHMFATKNYPQLPKAAEKSGRAVSE